jgi:hypothetical protein
VDLRAPNQAERLALELFLGQPNIAGIRQFARDHGVTVVLGGGADGTAGAGGFGSAGIYFGPNGEVGFTGSGGARAALQIGASMTAQVTIIRGGVDRLEGRFSMAGISGGEVLVGGGAVVFDPNTKEAIGFSVEIGIGGGLAPLELYVQDGWGTASDPINRPAAR